MNEIQEVGSGAVADQKKETCVTEIHEAYRAWGTAGLLLVECCVVWADKIGDTEFIRLAKEGELPFGEDRASRLLRVGRRKDILLAAKEGKLKDRYSIMYEATLIPKEDFQYAIKHNIISVDWGRDDIRSFKKKKEGRVHKGSYSSVEAQNIAEKTGNIVIDRSGKLHTGVDRQKAQDLQEKLDQAMELASAINLLANIAATPETLISDLSEFDYFPDKYLKPELIDQAINWLSELRRVRGGTK